MWNFSGRQNDIQGHGEINKGNWLSGIPFIDEKVRGLGPQENIPKTMANNKAEHLLYVTFYSRCYWTTISNKKE